MDIQLLRVKYEKEQKVKWNSVNVYFVCVCGLCACGLVCLCACSQKNHYSKLDIGSSHWSYMYLQKVASLESEMSQIRGITPPASLSQGLLNTPLSTSRVSTA